MRRMSDADIIISPEDRLGPSTDPRPPRQRGAAHAEAAPHARPMRAEAPAVPKTKPARKRRAPLLATLLTPFQRMVAAGVAAIGVLVFALVVWHSGAPQRAARALGDSLLALTAKAGFRVEDITVTGRSRTTSEEILAALGVKRGDPILGLDLEDAKDRLEAIPSVRAAAVERRLPHALHVVIAERRPVALWQHDGVFVLIDGEGHQIPGGIAGYEDLPLVVGDGAPVATADLLELISSEPALASRVKSAVWVGDRRWDIHLDDPVGGLLARLPEDQTEEAWHRLAKLEGDHGLTRRNVTMVDLRFGDRLVLRTARPETVHTAGGRHQSFVPRPAGAQHAELPRRRERGG